MPLISSTLLARRPAERDSERGYTLVALLALMTIMALFLTAAAPRIHQQAQREREIEAIFRGEQIAEAILLYMKNTGGNLPTSIDQLLEGVPRGTKKVQILRAAAARDPLSSSGEWRLIGPYDPAFIEFQRAVALYTGGTLPATREPYVARYAAQITRVTDIKPSAPAPGGEDDSASTSKQFIGVASRSRRNSVINYYGIDRHDSWVFTPLFK